MATPTPHHAPRRKKRPPPPPAALVESAPASSDAVAAPAAGFLEPGRRHEMISEAAYFLAERRDFSPGQELDDWLAAERDIDRVLTGSGCGV